MIKKTDFLAEYLYLIASKRFQVVAVKFYPANINELFLCVVEISNQENRTLILEELTEAPFMFLKSPCP